MECQSRTAESTVVAGTGVGLKMARLQSKVTSFVEGLWGGLLSVLFLKC
jgi:hypothetical protein